MRDHPIPFSAPMIDALLAGRKTQTRRLVKPQPLGVASIRVSGIGVAAYHYFDDRGERLVAVNVKTRREIWEYRPPAQVRDHLWVRESYFQFGHWEPIAGALTKGGRQKWGFVADRSEILFDAPAQFRRGMHHADPGTPAWHKRLGRFMPRKASRLTLTVTDVRVQRLKDIDEADALAEGAIRLPCSVPPGSPEQWMFHHGQELGLYEGFVTARSSFRHLWNSINGESAWAADPWIVAYTFTVQRGNIDSLTKEAA